MTPDERREFAQDVAAALAEAFDNRRGLSDETHDEHHDWVQAKIEKERARTEFWKQLATKSFPVIVLSLIGTVGTAIWKYFAEHFAWK